MKFEKACRSLYRKSWGNLFNDYIFEISGFRCLKCTVVCAICLTLILKSAQTRCGNSCMEDSDRFQRKRCLLFRIITDLSFILPYIWYFSVKSTLRWEKDYRKIANCGQNSCKIVSGQLSKIAALRLWLLCKIPSKQPNL